jgi:CBS domain-containing protein
VRAHESKQGTGLAPLVDMTDPKTSERQVQVPVKSRTTLGEHDVAVAYAVSCPVQGKDVPLDECAHCARSDGFRTVHGRATVGCRVDESAEATSDPSLIPLSSIMTTDVICVAPDLSVGSLESLLVDRGISGVPVVDAAGRPIGIVSRTDLVRHHRDRAGAIEADGTRVDDIMMPIPFCLPANESVAKAAALMAFEGVHRIPVVGASGAVIGIVVPLDIARWLARHHGYVIATRD